jgi:hypothetical protein
VLIALLLCFHCVLIALLLCFHCVLPVTSTQRT